MTYPQGYPQQQPPYGQQPPGNYPPSGGSAAGAVIAGLLGLVGAGGLATVTVHLLTNLGGVSFGDLPGETKTVVIVQAVAAVVLLVGAIIVFARKVAGAFVLAFGGLFGVVAVLLPPLIVPQADFGAYFNQIFSFAGPEEIASAVALIASPLALICVVLPPSINYLRGGSAPRQPGGW